MALNLHLIHVLICDEELRRVRRIRSTSHIVKIASFRWQYELRFSISFTVFIENTYLIAVDTEWETEDRELVVPCQQSKDAYKSLFSIELDYDGKNELHLSTVGIWQFGCVAYFWNFHHKLERMRDDFPLGKGKFDQIQQIRIAPTLHSMHRR